MSKNSLLGTALSKMYGIVATDWARTTLRSRIIGTPLEKIRMSADPLMEMVVEDEMKELYETLKLYYEES